MEFKKIGRFEKTNLKTAIASAFKQIEDKKYAQELLDRGINRILYLALAFEGKKVVIRSKKPDNLPKNLLGTLLKYKKLYSQVN